MTFPYIIRSSNPKVEIFWRVNVFTLNICLGNFVNLRVCFEPVNEAHTLSERDGSLILYIRYISDYYYMYDSDRPS